MFKYEVRYPTQTIRAWDGALDQVMGLPIITLSIRSPFDFFLKKFSDQSLRKTSVISSATVRGTSSVINTYTIYSSITFLEEYERVYRWPKYCREFDALIEEELGKKTEDKV